MEEQKHSGLGIASLITSIVSGTLTFSLLVIAGLMEASTPGATDDEFAGMILFQFAFMGTSVALGLGIGGLFQKERQKIFAILGTVLAAVTIVGTIIITMLGIAMD